MSSKFLEHLRRQRDEYQQTLEAITNLAAEQDRDLSDSEQANVTEIATKLAPLDERIAQMNASEKARLDYLDQARALDGQASGLRPAVGSQLAPQGTDSRSAGQLFTESEALTVFQRHGGHGRSAAVEVPAFYAQRQGIITGAELSDLIPPQLLPTIVSPPERPSILQVLRRASTRSDTIQYVAEDPSKDTGAAAVVPEKAAKPQLGFGFTPHTVTISTVAAWVGATRQALDDVTQLRTYIDGRLRNAVIKKIADYVLNGEAGTGNPGLLAGALHAEGYDMVLGVLNAIAAINDADYDPTAILMNGTDWYGLLGSVWGRATGLGDMVMTSTVPARIAGLPVITSPDVAAGTALVGDFQDGATLWDREQTRVMVADQHADWFIHNQLVILCEARVGLAIYEPEAFCTVEVVEPPVPPETPASASLSAKSAPPRQQPRA